MYDYEYSMRDDIISYISGHYTLAEILEKLDDADAWREELDEDLFCDDSVTGNASGSYTFNTWKAKEYVTENMDLCREMVEEFCVDSETVSEHFLNEDWEWFDVSIRCCVLGEVISEVMDALTECKDVLREELRHAEAEDISRERLEEIMEEAA